MGLVVSLLGSLAALVLAAPYCAPSALPRVAPLAATPPTSRPAPLSAAPVASSAQASRTVADRWLPPLGYTLELLQAFRPPPTPYTAGHRGIDLFAAQGESVAAPAAGTVTFAGAVAGRGVVSLRVDSHTVLSVEPVGGAVSAGDRVVAGQLIGEVATGGHCVADCLHLGVRVDDRYVNPMRFFRAKPQLLPWDD